jgi:hypothetical protein
MTTTELKSPFPVLVADVRTWRVLAWFGIQSLLTLSRVVLVYLQAGCAGKTVRNTTLAPLMLDTSPVLRRDTEGPCNAVDLNKQDEKLRLRLFVSKDKTDYSHPVIVPEDEVLDSSVLQVRISAMIKGLLYLSSERGAASSYLSFSPPQLVHLSCSILAEQLFTLAGMIPDAQLYRPSYQNLDHRSLTNCQQSGRVAWVQWPK